MRLFKIKLKGIIGADLALSPLMIMAVAVSTIIFLMIVYSGICYLFFSQIIIAGARDASVNSNVGEMQSRIYNGIVKVLPESRYGVQLIQSADISINPSDGDYVTVRGRYRIMLPGVDFFVNLGGNASNWTVPIESTFSFYREY